MGYEPVPSTNAGAPGDGESAFIAALNEVIDTRVDERTRRVLELLSRQIAVAVSEALGATSAQTPEVIFLTIPAAARLLSLSRSTVYDLIRRGQLETVKVGGARRIRVDALRAFERSLSGGRAAARDSDSEQPRRTVPAEVSEEP